MHRVERKLCCLQRNAWVMRDPNLQVPSRSSSWHILCPHGSRASDHLISAKTSESLKQPWYHCPHSQMHPLHLYFFPRNGSNYLQVENTRARRLLHLAPAEKENAQPPFSQLRRRNTSFSFSRRAPPAPTNLLTIHQRAKAVPSSTDTISNNPHSQLCISLIIS